MKPRPKTQKQSEMNISSQLENIDEHLLLPHHFPNHNQNEHNTRAPSEPVFSQTTHPNTNQTQNEHTSAIGFDHLDGTDRKIEDFGIGAMNTIDIHLCVEDNTHKNETEIDHKNDEEKSQLLSSIQKHNKYMFTNKSTKQFYFAPFHKDETDWHIFEFNDIFASETSFLSDLFSNVIQPLIQSFKNGKSACLALYSPDKTEWNDRLQLFDIVHQILLQLNIDKFECKVSAYEINDDNAYDLLPIKASHSATRKYLKNMNDNNLLQFCQNNKINRAPLKLALNRSLHTTLVNINKIGIKSIETGLQYLERSHNLFKGNQSTHFVYTINANNTELRIVEMCTTDPSTNQSLLNMKQCIKVLKRNKENQSRLRKSLVVPFRRHIFTKLFQEFIDGTSLFSFLFYLPPINRDKITKELYLERILSLLKYSNKSMHVSPYVPLSKEYKLSQHSTLTNSPQKKQSAEVTKMDSLSFSMIENTDSNINMKSLLDRAHSELAMSREQNEQLLTHKNHTITQLSLQVDTTRNDYEKVIKSQSQKIKLLVKQSSDMCSEKVELKKENKILSQSTNQIKQFLSQITKLLQINIDCVQNFSWQHIVSKIHKQINKIASLESVIAKVNKSYESDMKIYEEQISHSQLTINDKNKQIQSLSTQISDINAKHSKELQDLRGIIDELSVQNTPNNEEIPLTKQLNDEKSKNVHLEFQSIVHQQLSNKMQQIQNKMRTQFTKESEKYKSEIIDLKSEIAEFKNINLKNGKKLKDLNNITQSYNETQKSLKESNLENTNLKSEFKKIKQSFSELQQSMDSKQKDMEYVTHLYNELLQESQSVHTDFDELKVENDLVTRAYQEMKLEYTQFKKQSTHDCDTSLHELTQSYVRSEDLSALLRQSELKWTRAQKQNKCLIKKIATFRSKRRTLKSDHSVVKFQCVVHRVLYTSLKKKSAQKLEEYDRVIRDKDEKYEQLLSKYNKMNGIGMDNIIQTLESDKENLQFTNRQLTEQTNVFRFQSAAHHKVAQTVKQSKNELKLQVLQLLKQHAPNDEIKQILKETHTQKLNIGNQSQKIASIESNNNNYKLDKLKSIFISQIRDLKNEVCEIKSVSAFATNNIRKEMTKIVNDYDTKLKHVRNANEILQQTIDRLNANKVEIYQQFLKMSKLNEEMQIENEQLLDQKISSHDRHAQSQMEINDLKQLLFNKLTLLFCYKNKCETIQTNETIHALKLMELNSEIQTLEKAKEESQSNHTGVMLEWIDAKDTINKLLKENETLKDKTLSNLKTFVTDTKRNQTNFEFCNDPSHESKILALNRKFGLMCLNIEKIQFESFEFVQKAVRLRDENIKFKKANRKLRNEMKHLKAEMSEMRECSNSSCAESVQSNENMNISQNEIDLQYLKMKISDCFRTFNEKNEMKIFANVRNYNKMNERLNVCLDKVSVVKCKQIRNRANITSVVCQIMDLSENVSNKMKQRCNERLVLFEMRCDGITRNIRLIKCAFDNKAKIAKKEKLNKQNKIEKYLYNLQMNLKIVNKSFKNEMSENIKYSLHKYESEQKQIKSNILSVFELINSNNLMKVRQKLRETQKERDRHRKDKHLLQKEMLSMSAALDDLNESKTTLVNKLQKLIAFQQNTSQIKQKMEEYTQLHQCNQDRIAQLESMKITLENNNISQLQKMQKTISENGLFKIENNTQKQTIDDCNSQMSKQKETIHILESKCTEFEKHIQILKSETKTSDNKWKNDKIELLHKVAEFEQKIYKSESEINAQKTKLRQLMQSIEALKREKGVQKSELMKQIQTSKLETQINANIINNYNSEITKLNQKYNGERKINKDLERKLTKLQNNHFKIIKLQQIIEMSESKLSEFETQNSLLRKERSECEIKLDKLKECIICKLKSINHRYNGKINEIQTLKAQHCSEKEAINLKLDRLSIVIKHKMNSFTNILRTKDCEFNELMNESNEKKAIETKYIMIEEENEMLKKCKYKLCADIEELNGMLNASHSKHRIIRQLYDESNKSNKKLERERAESAVQFALMKHETAQINKYRSHLKERLDDLEQRMLRYKEKYKSFGAECNILRKKCNILDQMRRLSDNQCNALEFDAKSSQIREKLLIDIIKKMSRENDDLLRQSYDILMVKIDTNNKLQINKSMDCSPIFVKERVSDLKGECNYYLKILRFNDANHNDLKQRTALYTHQILSHWQKMFEKLTSIINIKSYTIEILHKNVSQIAAVTDIDAHCDLRKENKALAHTISAMTEKLSKVESRHAKEKTELKGLLDREINSAHSQRDCMASEIDVYRDKLQTFYAKYHRVNQRKEQQKLAMAMDNMRHEMTQLTQENVTMATVTNSLREIVRAEQDESNKLKHQNEEMYRDVAQLCQCMRHISGETFLSEDELENTFNNSEHLPQMICAVKEKALSLSSSKSSLHSLNQCLICEQGFNAMVFRYKCAICDQNHCSLCAPKNEESKARVCHTCSRRQLNQTK